MTYKFMHTADLHIDTDHHSRINPQTGISYAVESNLASVHHLVQQAIEKQVDLFLIAGDLFSNGKPTVEHTLLLAEVLQPLVDEGISISMDEGNHERLLVPAKHRTPVEQIAKLLQFATYTVRLPSLKHLAGIDLLSIPYPPKSQILTELGETKVDPVKGDSLVVKYILNSCQELLREHDDNVPLVVSGHFTISGIGLPGSEHDMANLMNEVVFPTNGIADLGASYVALGHIHTPQQIGDNIWYSGSPNKFTFTDAEDIKGGNLITLDGDSPIVEKIVTPVRGMYKVDLANEEFSLELHENDAVQVTLKEGETELPKNIKKAAEKAKANLVLKTRAAKKPTVTRTVLPEKISPLSALETHLKEQHVDAEEIPKLISKAKKLGVEG